MDKIYIVCGQDVHDEMDKIQLLGIYDNEAMAVAREMEMMDRFDSTWVEEGNINVARNF
jgi:hypothetical protein